MARPDFAWSISPSRFRWYLARLLPIVAVVLGLTYAAGFAADHLTAARSLGVDAGNSFDGYGTRGVLLVATGFVLMAGAIGLGAVIGRVLPTAILALILGGLGVQAVAKIHEHLTATRRSSSTRRTWTRDRYIDQSSSCRTGGSLAGWN